MAKKKTLAALIATILGAILYRLGGWGRPFRSWMRDWIIPVLVYPLLIWLKYPPLLTNWWLIIPSIALTGAALTTYWDNVFGFDNFWFHGFMVGLGAFPLIWAGIPWWLILLRSIILALFMGGLNWWVHKYKIKYSDVIEETLRGFAIVISVLLLLL